MKYLRLFKIKNLIPNKKKTKNYNYLTQMNLKIKPKSDN